MSKDSKVKTILKNNLYFINLIRKASPFRIVFAIIVRLLQCITDFVVSVYLLRYIVNSISKGMTFSNIFYVTMGFLCFLIISSFIETYYYEFFEPVSNQDIYKYLQRILYNKSAQVELTCYEQPEFYNNYIKAASEAYTRALKIINSTAYLAGWIFLINSISIVIFTIDPLLIMISLVPLVIKLIFEKKSSEVNYDYDMEMIDVNRKKDYIKRVFYLKDYAKELRLSNIDKVMLRKYRQAVQEGISVVKKYGYKVAIINYISSVIAIDILVYLGTIFYSVFKTLVLKGMLLGDCIVVVNNITSVSAIIRQIMSNVLEFYSHSLYISNIRNFLDYESKDYKKRLNDKEVEVDNIHLELKNVFFTYEGQTEPALKNINMEIKHKQKIALVGHNGAGKSTLVKLILNLYEPTYGSILMNGVDIRNYNVDSYRGMFGTVFQDFKVFALSIAENVLMREVKSEDEVKCVLDSVKYSGIYEKVNTLKNGINTLLTKEFSDDGVILSYGETQKIAIARVFAKDCSIVILDEPTSALDPVSEHDIFEKMMQACKDKSVIFISHRLSSTMMADKIYLLENGEIVEEGSHVELMTLNGRYAEMFNKQAENYNRKSSVQ